MEGFQHRYAELQALDARVVGVSTDTWATQGAFAKQAGLEFPLLSDWPNGRTVASIRRSSASKARRRAG